ncbi:MAG: MFS transporter [Streptosporangiales bacterium]|nr:MFS transporter [Streptosporangiales bacterium]
MSQETALPPEQPAESPATDVKKQSPTRALVDHTQLVIFRFIAGLGLGGEFGTLLGVLVAGPIIAAWGWRALFVIGAIPALLAWVLRRTLHEPEKFVEQQKARPRGGPSPLRLLVVDRRTAVTSLAVLVLCSVQTFGYYGIMTWMPTYLGETLGFSLTKSGVWTAVTIAGMIVGMPIFGRIADRIGRKPSFWIFQAGAIVSVLVYSQLGTPGALLIGGAVLGLFVNGMLGGYGALMAELYPTAARATAQNVLFNLGRAVGGFAPIVFALIAESNGFGLAIAMLAVLYAIDMLAVAVLPERRGAELT